MSFGDIRRSFSSLLAFVGYHMYYNLRNWYTLISFLPAYSVNKRFFDRMIGVEPGSDDEPPTTSLIRRYGIDLPRVVFQALRIGSSFFFMESLVRRFNGTFDEVYSELDAIELARMDQEALVELYHNVSESMLALWWVPIANDFAVMVSTGTGHEGARRLGDQQGRRLPNPVPENRWKPHVPGSRAVPRPDSRGDQGRRACTRAVPSTDGPSRPP